jgi:DNA-3-methyladenine glycosylase II
MRELVEAHDFPQIVKVPIFISLVRAVISQQLSEAAASTIFKRLSATTEILPGTLSSLDIGAYRQCGISSRKAEYIKGIAEAVLKEEIGHIADLNDDDAIKVLLSRKGLPSIKRNPMALFCPTEPIN